MLPCESYRWNDAIEGGGNFHVDGGFNRDADIYGNLMCFANDDAVEIDGGQTNVRVFLTRTRQSPSAQRQVSRRECHGES